MTMEYKKATEENTREITMLVRETITGVYPKYYPKEIVDFFLALHTEKNIGKDIRSGNTYVLYDGQCLAGTGSLEGDHITRVYVAPRFQGKGHGSIIIKKLEEKIFSEFNKVVLDASLPACHLYETLGYRTSRHESWTVENNVILVYEVMEKEKNQEEEVEIRLIRDRGEIFINQLFCLWKKSVKATHLFLTPEETERIAGYVPGALRQVPQLIAALNADGIPLAFMGIDGRKLEMLFVRPEKRGTGLGGRLLRHAIERYGVNEVCVNEQNPQAAGFYEHGGFQTYRRTDTDEQGGPYPLLYMKRPGEEG